MHLFQKTLTFIFALSETRLPPASFLLSVHGSSKFLKNRTTITMTIDVTANQTTSDLVMRPLIQIYLSIYLFTYLFIYLYIYLFIYLFVYSSSKKTDVKKHKFWLFNSSTAKVSFFYYFYELLTLIVKRIWYYIKYAWCDCLCS